MNPSKVAILRSATPAPKDSLPHADAAGSDSDFGSVLKAASIAPRKSGAQDKPRDTAAHDPKPAPAAAPDAAGASAQAVAPQHAKAAQADAPASPPPGPAVAAAASTAATAATAPTSSASPASCGSVAVSSATGATPATLPGVSGAGADALAQAGIAAVAAAASSPSTGAVAATAATATTAAPTPTDATGQPAAPENSSRSTPRPAPDAGAMASVPAPSGAVAPWLARLPDSTQAAADPLVSRQVPGLSVTAGDASSGANAGSQQDNASTAGQPDHKATVSSRFDPMLDASAATPDAQAPDASALALSVASQRTQAVTQSIASALEPVALKSVEESVTRAATAPLTAAGPDAAGFAASSPLPAPTAFAADAHASVATPLGQPGFGQDLSQQVVMLTRRGVQSAQISLDPAGLGPVSVTIQVHGHAATLAFNAAHETTRDALQAALPRLREMFASSGMQLADATVGGRSQPDWGPGPRYEAPGHDRTVTDVAAAAEPAVAARGVLVRLVDTYA